MTVHKGESFSDLATAPQTADDRMLEYVMSFVFAVEDRLEELGMSRADLARKLGCRRSQVSNVLGGTGNVTLKTIAKYDAALGLDLEIRSRRSGVSEKWPYPKRGESSWGQQASTKVVKKKYTVVS
jgi:ribosome-binding protein aMBF1 (putative translation factor)